MNRRARDGWSKRPALTMTPEYPAHTKKVRRSRGKKWRRVKEKEVRRRPPQLCWIHVVCMTYDSCPLRRLQPYPIYQCWQTITFIYEVSVLMSYRQGNKDGCNSNYFKMNTDVLYARRKAAAVTLCGQQARRVKRWYAQDIQVLAIEEAEQKKAWWSFVKQTRSSLEFIS